MIRILYITVFLINLIYSQIQVKKITDGLDKPIYAKSIILESEVIFIVEQDGRIKIIRNSVLSKDIFLDISDRVQNPFYPGDERGLLGFELDPDFDQNGYFYVNYVNKDNVTIISRFSSKNLVADNNSEYNIISIKQPYSNHNGGHIAFGPDNYLYISVGDGGSAGDPEDRAQNLESLLGKILRIDVSRKVYNIPKDNPFYKSPNFKQEIWSYGLRNVWRFSFDTYNGNMYLADVGQNNWEEINYEVISSGGGVNYGWNLMEGKHCFDEENMCDPSLYQLPIYEYPNNANYIKTLVGLKQPNTDGCSVTGGYVYRGESIPSMYGRYIFGDYCTGKVWSFINKNGQVDDFKDHSQEVLISMNEKSFYLSSFGEKYNGELFLIDYNGALYEIIKVEN